MRRRLEENRIAVAFESAELPALSIPAIHAGGRRRNRKGREWGEKRVRGDTQRPMSAWGDIQSFGGKRLQDGGFGPIGSNRDEAADTRATNELPRTIYGFPGTSSREIVLFIGIGS